MTTANTEDNPNFINRVPTPPEHKIFVSRIPVSFDDASVKRLLQEQLGADAVIHVALAYEKETEEEGVKEDDRFHRAKKKPKLVVDDDRQPQQHRGFGFVALRNTQLVHKAIHEVQTIRGGAKPSSTKKHTLYIGPCLNDTEPDDPRRQPCFLYAKGRCPYGVTCKFSHDGPTIPQTATVPTHQQESSKGGKKPKKCRDHRKGKCRRGDACPFSHDFEPKRLLLVGGTNMETATGKRPDSEKNCINWKTKGKCRKRETTCPYRHDLAVQQAALAKKAKRARGGGEIMNNHKEEQQLQRKPKQPLSVRVFGLNYESKEVDVRRFFADCGTIVKVDFPTFADSGRGKGYCGVTFQSPKAVEQAVRRSGTELQGRWLSVQAGKMMLEEWERHHTDRASHQPSDGATFGADALS